MSEKELNALTPEQENNETAAAAPAEDTSAQAVGEAIAEINSDAQIDAEPAAAEAPAVKPIVTAKSKRQLKKEEKQRAKELKAVYHVSNWQIIKNYRHYSDSEKKHYKYIFRRRITDRVWPVFRFLILFGLAFVIMYPMLYMLSTAIRPQEEMSDASVMWIPKQVIFPNFVDVWIAMDFPRVMLQTILINVLCSLIQVVTCGVTGYGFARFKFKGKGLMFMIVILQVIVPVQVILIPVYMQFYL